VVDDAEAMYPVRIDPTFTDPQATDFLQRFDRVRLP